MLNNPTVHFEYNEDSNARSPVVYENGDSEQLKLTALACFARSPGARP
jgi:hypothetical protein